MRKIILCTFAFVSIVICANKSFAQNDYYYYNNQKILLEKILNKKYLVYENIQDTNELKQKLNLPDAKVFKCNNTNVMGSIVPYKGQAKPEKNLH
jgi:uncharacterized protein with ParB-like and HNH nuclease domain